MSGNVIDIVCFTLHERMLKLGVYPESSTACPNSYLLFECILREFIVKFNLKLKNLVLFIVTCHHLSTKFVAVLMCLFKMLVI